MKSGRQGSYRSPKAFEIAGDKQGINTGHDVWSIDAVLSAIEVASTSGLRNRCMYLLKGVLRYSDISHLRIYQVVDCGGEVIRWINAGGRFSELGDRTRRELACYLRHKYSLDASAHLGALLVSNRDDSVFSSARRPYLTPTVVAQVISDADRAASSLAAAEKGL